MTSVEARVSEHDESVLATSKRSTNPRNETLLAGRVETAIIDDDDSRVAPSELEIENLA